ncbi:MAG: hypothetical protein HY330_01435 [Chloroflexi bacterium]|nr:hypothetical protein [Chloroflexota bacterium]
MIPTDSAGAQKASVAYYPFGATRSSSGTLGTDRKFTGQRNDLTGLYYYGARLGRFLSPDLLIQDRRNSQGLNRK